MKPPQQHSRINLAELQAQIVKRLGPERSKQYFNFLHRFLSCKLPKLEFNKLSLRILGRKNIPLHNQFISSILRNACTAKSPPPAGYIDDVSKHATRVDGCEEIETDGYQPNGSHKSATQPNGSHNVLPISPRKARSGGRDRRIGKTNVTPQLAPNKSSDSNVVSENNDLNPPNVERLLQHHQDIAQPSQNKSEVLVSHHSKIPPIVTRSDDGSALVHSKDQTDLVVSKSSTLRAPLGVLSPPVSVSVAHRTLPQENSNKRLDMFSRGALLDNDALKEQMEHIAVVQGLNGVSMDCANILNHGLDSYLKGLIRSCIQVVGARSGQRSTKNDPYNDNMKIINGLRPGYQLLIQNSSSNHSGPISLQDLRVAMELNARQFGQDWPLLLEKISRHEFEE